MERMEVTITYNMPENEFRALAQNYPTGAYLDSSNSACEWFRVTIPSPNGEVKLTWFLE